jgi:hypothetical protein
MTYLSKPVILIFNYHIYFYLIQRLTSECKFYVHLSFTYLSHMNFLSKPYFLMSYSAFIYFLSLPLYTKIHVCMDFILFTAVSTPRTIPYSLCILMILRKRNDKFSSISLEGTKECQYQLTSITLINNE